MKSLNTSVQKIWVSTALFSGSPKSPFSRKLVPVMRWTNGYHAGKFLRGRVKNMLELTDKISDDSKRRSVRFDDLSKIFLDEMSKFSSIPPTDAAKSRLKSLLDESKVLTGTGDLARGWPDRTYYDATARQTDKHAAPLSLPGYTSIEGSGR